MKTFSPAISFYCVLRTPQSSSMMHVLKTEGCITLTVQKPNLLSLSFKTEALLIRWIRSPQLITTQFWREQSGLGCGNCETVKGVPFKPRWGPGLPLQRQITVLPWSVFSLCWGQCQCTSNPRWWIHSNQSQLPHPPSSPLQGDGRIHPTGFLWSWKGSSAVAKGHKWMLHSGTNRAGKLRHLCG